MLMKKLTVNKQTEEKLRKEILIVLDRMVTPILSFCFKCVELHSQQEVLGTTSLTYKIRDLAG